MSDFDDEVFRELIDTIKENNKVMVENTGEVRKLTQNGILKNMEDRIKAHITIRMALSVGIMGSLITLVYLIASNS